MKIRISKNPPAMWETWVGKIPWRRERLPTPVFWPGEFHGLYNPHGVRLFSPPQLSDFHFHNNVSAFQISRFTFFFSLIGDSRLKSCFSADKVQSTSLGVEDSKASFTPGELLLFLTLVLFVCF